MKKNFKMFLGTMLALVMIISLIACGKSEETVNNTPSPTQAPAEQNNNNDSTPAPTEAPAVDLGGIEVLVADWWSVIPPPEPATQREEDTLAFREEFMERHNFTISRVNLGTWQEYQEIVVSSIMAGDPAADVFIMDQSFVSAPLRQGLLYPLNTLKNFNFSEDKWNKQVLDLMTFDGNIYGVSSGRMEPRLGIFWNKRLFEEAGIDPELPYDLQASGEWTWDALKDLARRLTRDLDNDGTPDVYGIASFSKHFFRGMVFSNGGMFIGRDENGKFYNATSDPRVLEALEYGRTFYDEGYHMPQPEGSNWDWFTAAFSESKVAMQCSEQYTVNTWKDMDDDWGFVIFPKGPKGEMMTVFFENVVVMPSNLSEERAEAVAFAYNLYTETTPGYEDDDSYWKTNYYPVFRDARAVDETLELFYNPKHSTMSLLKMVGGIDYGGIVFSIDGGSATPAEAIERGSNMWQDFIDEANGLEVAD